MKPYKSKKMNNKIRKCVRKAYDWLKSHPDYNRKYLSNEEYTMDMSTLCGISYNMAKRVTWIVRADGYRNRLAEETWGFNRYTA